MSPVRRCTRSTLLVVWCAGFSLFACGPTEAGEREGSGEGSPDGMKAPALVAGSRPVTVGAITVRSVRVPEAAAGARTSVYARIENAAGASDRLVSLRSEDAEAASLHRMQHEGGYMTMEPIAAVELPAGAVLTLEPGALHGMLERLERPLVPGDSVRVVFGFESGTTVEVPAPVVSLLDLVEAPEGGH